MTLFDVCDTYSLVWLCSIFVTPTVLYGFIRSLWHLQSCITLFDVFHIRNLVWWRLFLYSKDSLNFSLVSSTHSVACFIFITTNSDFKVSSISFFRLSCLTIIIILIVLITWNEVNLGVNFNSPSFYYFFIVYPLLFFATFAYEIHHN